MQCHPRTLIFAVTNTRATVSDKTKEGGHRTTTGATLRITVNSLTNLIVAHIINAPSLLWFAGAKVESKEKKMIGMVLGFLCEPNDNLLLLSLF